jgi:chemotaxis protein methyltransferase CheR
VIRLQGDEGRVLSQYVYTLCGVHLDDTKGYLLESRLATLLQETNCASFSELYVKSRADTTKTLARRIVDAVTTGETSFFRDDSPFDLLQHKLIPDLIDRRKKVFPPGTAIPLRIWSAACSTGQEVYTIAMILKEMLGNLNGYNIRLLGTDISDQAVARASAGVFNQMEIDRGLKAERLTRFFNPLNGGWKVRDELRALVSFRKLNLMEEFTGLEPFDIIFCRNVAIYFTEADKLRLFQRISRVMAPDGALVIGATESLTGLCPQFEALRYLRSVFYRLK